MTQIQVLQQGLLNINAPYLARLQDSSCSRGIKGKNNARKSRKYDLSGTDSWNATIISSYIRETVWPSNKILPGLWAKWIEDERSLSQQIMKKITLPPGISGKEYWENFLVGIANDKFCSLRSNLKQGLFVQYEGNQGRNTAMASKHGFKFFICLSNTNSHISHNMHPMLCSFQVIVKQDKITSMQHQKFTRTSEVGQQNKALNQRMNKLNHS